jgi:hypothetical protein
VFLDGMGSREVVKGSAEDGGGGCLQSIQVDFCDHQTNIYE